MASILTGDGVTLLGTLFVGWMIVVMARDGMRKLERIWDGRT